MSSTVISQERYRIILCVKKWFMALTYIPPNDVMNLVKGNPSPQPFLHPLTLPPTPTPSNDNDIIPKSTWARPQLAPLTSLWQVTWPIECHVTKKPSSSIKTDGSERLTVISKSRVGKGDKENSVRLNSPVMPIRKTPVAICLTIVRRPDEGPEIPASILTTSPEHLRHEWSLEPYVSQHVGLHLLLSNHQNLTLPGGWVSREQHSEWSNHFKVHRLGYVETSDEGFSGGKSTGGW